MAKTQTQFQWFDQRDNQWHILPCGRVFDDPREAQEYFKKHSRCLVLIYERFINNTTIYCLT